MSKEQNCFYYFPGDITIITKEALSNLISRTKWFSFLKNDMWLGGKYDNQRETNGLYYIYANDNLLGGK